MRQQPPETSIAETRLGRAAATLGGYLGGGNTGLRILTVPVSAGSGRVEAELASVVAELSGSTWADGNVGGPMQPTFYQFIVAGAMLVNAIVGHLLYRAAFADAGHEPVIAATALALAVAGIAVQILVRPVAWALDLARGAAVGMLLGLAAIGLLAFVAANFENGLSQGGFGGAGALMVGLFVVQLAILFGSARIEGRDLGASGGSIARGAVQFWLIVLGVSFVAHMLETSLP